jgi:hypothetical protein
MPRKHAMSAGAYSIERRMWDLIILAPSGCWALECATVGRAISQVQRLNQCRVVMRKEAYESHKANGVRIDAGTTQRMYWEEEVETMAAQYTEADEYTIRRPDNGSRIEVRRREPLFTEMRNAEGKVAQFNNMGDRPKLKSDQYIGNVQITDEWGKPLQNTSADYRGFGDIGLDPDQPLGLDVGEKK